MGGAVRGARRAPEYSLRADLRKPRRHDGSEQSASALPDLVEPRSSERGGQGAGVSGSLATPAWRVPALRVRAHGGSGKGAHRGTERALDDSGAVLGDLAVRDDGDCA